MSRTPSIGAAVAVVSLFAAAGIGSIAVILYGLYVLVSGHPATEPDGGPVAVLGDVARGAEIPAGSLFADQVEYTFLVYHLSRAAPSGVELVRAEVESGPASLTIRESDAGPAPLPSVLVRDVSADELPPPPPELMPRVSRGLTRAQSEQLQRTKRVTLLHFRSPGGVAGLAHLRDAYALTLAVAKQSRGLIFDAATGEVFSREAWEGTRVATWRSGLPYLPEHFVIQNDHAGTLNRAVTIGLERVGLPNLVFDDFPRSSTHAVDDLLNLAAQTMMERGELSTAGRLQVAIDRLENRRMRELMIESCLQGAEKRAVLALAIAQREQGDPGNRLWEIVFPGDPEALQERQQELLDRIFGSADEVSEVEHDAEILAASERARERLLGELKRKFVAGLAPKERLLVKAAFETPEGGNEWMWFEVIAWEDRQLRGILMNDPVHIPDLNSGARVVKSEADLFDYVFYAADGEKRGNETGEIMMRRQAAGR